MGQAEAFVSVLIPNYDWDVTGLVKDLHGQLCSSQVSFEILCFDEVPDYLKSIKKFECRPDAT